MNWCFCMLETLFAKVRKRNDIHPTCENKIQRDEIKKRVDSHPPDSHIERKMFRSKPYN